MLQEVSSCAFSSSSEGIPHGHLVKIHDLYPEINGKTGVVVGHADLQPIVMLPDVVNPETYPYKALIVPQMNAEVLYDDKGFITEERLKTETAEFWWDFNMRQHKAFQESCRESDTAIEQNKYERNKAMSAENVHVLYDKATNSTVEAPNKDAVAKQAAEKACQQLNKELNAVNEHFVNRKETKYTKDETRQYCYTAEADVALKAAVSEAKRLDHDYIGTEHLLLGLIFGNNDQVVVRLLQALDVNVHQLKMEVEKLVSGGIETIAMGNFPRTPRAQNVLMYAKEGAGDRAIGTIDILRGIFREKEGIAAQALMNVGITEEKVRDFLNKDSSAASRYERISRHFSVHVQSIMRQAALEAGRRKQQFIPLEEGGKRDPYFIAPEHILLGLLGSPCYYSSEILRKIIVSTDKMQSLMPVLYSRLPLPCRHDVVISYSCDCSSLAVLEYAYAAAKEDNAHSGDPDDNFKIGTDHILLGLVSCCPYTTACKTLYEFSVNEETVCEFLYGYKKDESDLKVTESNDAREILEEDYGVSHSSNEK
jgi:hypothetical protein